jgi:hypothetical protein
VQYPEYLSDKSQLRWLLAAAGSCKTTNQSCQNDVAALYLLPWRGRNPILLESYCESTFAVEGKPKSCQFRPHYALHSEIFDFVANFTTETNTADSKLQFANLTFVPIEPPRLKQDGEVYARRQHQFIHPPAFPDRKGSLMGSLLKDKEKMGTPASPVLPPARFSIDARLPNPAVLTCGQDLPLKVLIKQLNERSEELYLQTLQIELIGFTKVRAHEATRTETNSWVIISLSNLNQPIGAFNDPAETETELTKELWYGQRLPDTVAPSFITCNISRSYELQVSAGLSYGPRGGAVSFSIIFFGHILTSISSTSKILFCRFESRAWSFRVLRHHQT